MTKPDRRAQAREKMSLVLKERMEAFLEENACLGEGDLRAEITLEALQRTETRNHWLIEGKRLYRADVMQMILEMVASGYSLPAILDLPGFPRGITVMGWLKEYKDFREMFEAAGQFYAMVKAHEAETILDDSNDPKQAFRDKARSSLRMRMAEAFNPKLYGKKQIIDVSHHLDDLPSDQLISQFKSRLLAHRALWEEKLGVKIIVPALDDGKIQDAEVVETGLVTLDPERAGFQGYDETNDFEEGLVL